MKNIEEFTYTKYNGEMLPFERFKLTNWILNIKPTIVFEVGTGNGGGSTYFIAKALKELNNDDKVLFNKFMRLEKKPFLLKHIYLRIFFWGKWIKKPTI